MKLKKIFFGNISIMKASKLFAVIVWFISATGTFAQQPKGQAKPDAKQNEQKVRDMVAFLEYVLNTLGDGTTSARDKDVLITESYTKIFRNGKVQVEDDLVEKRNVITNKDVQAYLKDVDFFFNDVKFEFTIKDIQSKVNANDKLFYKVSLIRNMKGVNSEGIAVNNTIPRFIEINYDPKDQDLKIVSIYTKEFNERVALNLWWKELSFEWQSVFKRKLNIVTDSVTLSDIKNITSISTLDLSENKYLQNIEPLTQLADLQILDLSGTAITDISPLRNLTELIELDLSNTKVTDILPLKYCDKLVRLKVNNTSVSDLSVLEKMVNLEHFELASTNAINFAPLSNLTALKHLNLEATKIIDITPIETLSSLIFLNVSETGVGNLSPLGGLKNLTTLNLDYTSITDVSILRNLEKLEVLYVNHTAISNLRPLQELKSLEKIYCDNTPIKKTLADAFMASNPQVLVIYDSEDLKGWWETLPTAWKGILSNAAKIELDPTKEDLAKVTNLDSINFAGNIDIRDIVPLMKLQRLKTIVANKTSITDLSPLKEHREIRNLDIGYTRVGDIALLSQFSNLKVLNANNTDILNLDPLSGITGMQTLYADETAIDNKLVQEFLVKRPECLVVYRTWALEQWWNELPDGWKEVFQTQIPIRPNSRKEDLHRLIQLEELHFKDVPVNDLSVLNVFVRLKELDFSGTAITDISPLADVQSLMTLRATNSPVRDLTPLSFLTSLENLDVSNTPVEELKPLQNSRNLKTLNCAGTQISSLSALEYLESLQSLDCSNTRVKKIDPVKGLSLKTLKCYNTRVSGKAVAKFKKSNPECSVVHY